MKKFISVLISFSLFVTLLPANAFPSAIFFPQANNGSFNGFGKVTSACFYDDNLIVVNIQDLHNNKEVQENIYKFLTEINQRYNNVEIYIEGANDNVDFRKFINSVGKNNADILMDSLYKNGKISGTEYFGYKNDKVLKPVEQKDIYDKNIKNYSVLINAGKDIENLLALKHKQILSLNKYLTTQQKRILKLYDGYLNKKISPEKFYHRLYKEFAKREISPLSYVNTKIYFDILKENKKINRKKAEKQLRHLLLTLKSAIPFQEYTELVKRSNNLSDIDVIFSYINANTSPEDKFSKYPDLFKLIGLRDLSSLINPLDLVSEERRMIEDILLSYSKYSSNKDVVFINIFYQIYKKLLAAGINSAEYEYYKNNRDAFYADCNKYLPGGFYGLYGYSKVAEEFNELNLQRNGFFIKNILSGVKPAQTHGKEMFGKYSNINKVLSSLKKAGTIKVAVSGGFHTDGINRLLNDNKISYITLTPNVKNADSSYEKKYLKDIVMQADVERNAIAKMPFLEQNAVVFSNDTAYSLAAYRQTGKSWKEIKNIVDDIIASQGLQRTVSFEISGDEKEEQAVFSVSTGSGGKHFIFYDKGKVQIDENGASSTAMATNIKILIKEALKVASLRAILGLPEKYDSYYKAKGERTFNQISERLLMEHNILFPGFADICLMALVRDLDPDIEDKSGDRVYGALLEAKNNFTGEDFKNANISVGSTTALVGARADGFGGTEEYGCLLYVVREQNKSGIMSAKEILISDALLEGLAKIQSRTNIDLKEFFKNLFNHERLEFIAVSGRSQIFNNYVRENKLSKTTQVFHDFIITSDFIEFLKEQKMDSKNLPKQKELLEILGQIISAINEENSEYSDIVSVTSFQEKQEYSGREIDSFLGLRVGDPNVIQRYIETLASKIYAQIEREYVKSKNTGGQSFDMDKNLDVKDFIKFLNKYVVAYRLSNNRRYYEKVAEVLELKILEKCRIQPNSEKAKDIKITLVGIERNGVSTEYKNQFIIRDLKNVKGKNVLFIDDIVSKQSTTFNNIYNLFINSEANKVQGFVFFDLSGEQEQDVLTEKVYNRITENPDLLANAINGVGGNVQKYTAYWLIKLLKQNNREEFKRVIKGLDKTAKRQLILTLYGLLNENISIRNVVPCEIFYLILCVSAEDIIDKSVVTKENIDVLLEKTGVKDEIKQTKKVLEVRYDDWKDNIPLLIMYAYVTEHTVIDAFGINNLTQNERVSVVKFARMFNIEVADKKSKLKHTHKLMSRDEKFSRKIRKLSAELEGDKRTFKAKIQALERITDQDEYLRRMEQISSEYRQQIRDIMKTARDFALMILEERQIPLDNNLFLITVGGSLVKGNIMVDSDIYYDIIVPDRSISRSVEQHFAPLYSSILSEIGLTNYHVLKYSTTRMTRRNINTFVDEKETAVFLDYEPLDFQEKSFLYRQYMSNVFREACGKREETLRDLGIIARQYLSISEAGSGWIGDSYNISHNGSMTFNTRWTFMAFEAKLNEMVFRYLSEKENMNSVQFIPTTVKEQVDFISKYIFKGDKEKNDSLYSAYKALRSLSAYRYHKANNTWTQYTEKEKSERFIVNKFIKENSLFLKDDDVRQDAKPVENYEDVLGAVEEFVYNNSEGIESFRNGYNKYAHLETWMGDSGGANRDMWIKAKIIALLTETDTPQVREKLKNIAGIGAYLDGIFESLDAIKLIDKNFPAYSGLDGERTLQNYWDAIGITVKNPETFFALLAHKLTKAQNSFNQEDKYLLYSVYLPLAKRFGKADVYEYVRNDLFEYDHPKEYLNLLKILKILYGKTYSELPQINEEMRETLYKYFEGKGIPRDKIDIKYRVKSLYSIYEKLNSSRKDDKKNKNKLKGSDNEEFSVIEKKAVSFVAKSEDKLFVDIIKQKYPENYNEKKQQLAVIVGKDFYDLTDKEKSLVNDLIDVFKKSIFENPELVARLNMTINAVKQQIKKDPAKSGTEESLQLKQYLLEHNLDFELWFIDFFEENLKDLVGLHVVVNDDDYDGAVKVLETRETSVSGKKTEIDPVYSELVEFFKNETEKEKTLIFDKFAKDEENKQERLKINTTVKSGKISIPSEICFYKKTDYNDETYGLYNQKKISAPHFIYKMGKSWVARFFNHIFAKEVNLDFIDSAVRPSKQFIFKSDDFIPSDDLEENFRQIMDGYEDLISCFVEYDGKIFVMNLPKGSTIFDLAAGKDFSDDGNVSVYDILGEPLDGDMLLDHVKTYKIFKSKNHIKSPDEGDVLTVRGKLLYKKEYEVTKSEIIKKIFDFNKKALSAADIKNISEILLKYSSLIDLKNLSVGEIVSQIFESERKSGNEPEILGYRQEDIAEFIGILSTVARLYGLSNINMSSFILKSMQIAGHYNLADLFELFESVEYGLIKFDDIKFYYKTYIIINSNTGDEKKDRENEGKIVKIISDKMRIVKKNEGYNLEINQNKYCVYSDMSDFELIQALLDMEELGLEYVSDKNDRKMKGKNVPFVTVDFVQPKAPFALMSLGNNLEQLVKHASKYHSDMVKKIIAATTAGISGRESYDANDLSQAFEEYPVLMAQILLGLYGQDVYDEGELLSQETPLLSQREVSSMKENLAAGLESVNVSQAEIKISRSLDIIESENVYSFATLDINENGVAVLYISEAFIRCLNGKSPAERLYLLRQLVLHETGEYLALAGGKVSSYRDFHEQIVKDEGQAALLNFAESVAPDVFIAKNALYELADGLSARGLDVDPVAGSIGYLVSEWTKIIAGDIELSVNGKRNLNTVPLEILKDLLVLLPLLSASEKDGLLDILRKNEHLRTKETAFASLASQENFNSNAYGLISEFIAYLYSDGIDLRRQEMQSADEKTDSYGSAEKEKGIIVTKEQLRKDMNFIAEKSARTREMLACA